MSANVLVVATSTRQPESAALADLLTSTMSRVPLTVADIAAATGASQATVRRWLSHAAAPDGQDATRVSELLAVVDVLTRAMRPEAIVPWLRQQLNLLGGRRGLDVLASGGYAEVRELAAELASGTFT